MTDDAPAFVFIYDREFADDAESSESRISACREYARLMGWEVAGQWVEPQGSGNRLNWRGMAAAMAHQGNGRKAICLVSGWDRISIDPQEWVALRRLVHRAGGMCWSVDTASSVS
ncbi:recombinase family protein [Streptomyces iranensis]|uniref:DNA invertase Pin-like site-specific DNA recombinase n=1 Tax=Streptomyces iranensis TaxID=576784 RepID=A0ABS4MPT2_9ACTN|nr:recombinase family protein [Streptomyces iranensis]MBP2061717.1 DNA invertase Pin-like site-specific DNA recombinase [Streptomyces iranensis]